MSITTIILQLYLKVKSYRPRGELLYEKIRSFHREYNQKREGGLCKQLSIRLIRMVEQDLSLN